MVTAIQVPYRGGLGFRRETPVDKGEVAVMSRGMGWDESYLFHEHLPFAVLENRARGFARPVAPAFACLAPSLPSRG